MTRRSVFAPGKLLLFGEHSAVYGYPALGTALDRGLNLTLAENLGEHSGERAESAIPWTMEVLNEGESSAAPALDGERFGRHLHATLERYRREGAHLPPGRITLRPDLPLGSGFGSSAALCTGLARLSLRDVPGLSPFTVWRLGHELETYFHGTPSGIDTGLSALGGTQAFRFSDAGTLPSATACALPSLYLVAGSIPRERDTRTLVAGVRERLKEHPVETEEFLRTLGEISEAVIRESAIPGADPVRFGEAMNRAQEVLCRLGLSVPLLDGILARGRAAGAVGAKLSGAGGGGAFYLACTTEDTARAVESAIRELQPRGSTLFRVPADTTRHPSGDAIIPGRTARRS